MGDHAGIPREVPGTRQVLWNLGDSHGQCRVRTKDPDGKHECPQNKYFC